MGQKYVGNLVSAKRFNVHPGPGTRKLLLATRIQPEFLYQCNTDSMNPSSIYHHYPLTRN